MSLHVTADIEEVRANVEQVHMKHLAGHTITDISVVMSYIVQS